MRCPLSSPPDAERGQQPLLKTKKVPAKTTKEGEHESHYEGFFVDNEEDGQVKSAVE